MSIDSLVAGKVIRDCELKQSKNGTDYCQFLLSVNVGEPENTVISGVCFGEVAGKVGRLKKGDPLAVVGSMKPTTYTGKDGLEKSGLNITVSASLSPFDIKKRRAKPDQETSASKSQGTYQPPAKYSNDRPFDDEIDF